MRFRFSSIFKSYVGNNRVVHFESSQLVEALEKLDKEYPGIKFRIIDESGKIRPHVNIFLDSHLVKDLNVSLVEDSEVFIVQSLSGG